MLEHLSFSQWLNFALGLLLFVSESLPFTDAVKSNGLFQGALSLIQKLKK